MRLSAKQAKLKGELDRLYLKTNTADFIPLDPVKFPHRYKDLRDREIAAFLSATIAWGRRDLILKSCEKMFSLMGESPYTFVMKGRHHVKSSPRGFSIHRTFFEDDLYYFCCGLQACYKRYYTLQDLFASSPDIWEGITRFRQTIAEANGGNYSKHIASPDSGSACKRINLALRWLVRKEGPIDLGLWKKIPTSALFIPLDVHVGRAARSLGLLDCGRAANDRRAVISLTEQLREFCPEDPVKYDLALFTYGMENS